MRQYSLVFSNNTATNGSVFRIFYDDCITMNTMKRVLSFEGIVGVLFVGIMFCAGIV